MSKFADIEFLPSLKNSDLLDGLRVYARLLEENCGLGDGEERESSHYIEETYFKWYSHNCSITLFWCDEPGAQEWLNVSIDCKEGHAITVAQKICHDLAPFMDNFRIG